MFKVFRGFAACWTFLLYFQKNQHVKYYQFFDTLQKIPTIQIGHHFYNKVSLFIRYISIDERHSPKHIFDHRTCSLFQFLEEKNIYFAPTAVGSNLASLFLHGFFSLWGSSNFYLSSLNLKIEHQKIRLLSESKDKETTQIYSIQLVYGSSLKPNPLRLQVGWEFMLLFSIMCL